MLFYRHSFDATFMESPLSDLSSANSHGGDARQAIASPARNQLTPHVKWRYQPGDRNRLAVIMPGLLYHCDKPLFQALAQEFRQQGMGLLQCDFDYADDPDFMNAPKMNQLDQIYRDGKSIGDLVQRLGDFDEMFLVGKSLGAMAMAAALDSGNFDQARAIWVTPGLQNSTLGDQIIAHPGRSLVLMGDLDPSCLPETLAPLREAVQVRVAVIEGADHAFAASDLNSEEDLTQAAMQALANWMPLRPQG